MTVARYSIGFVLCLLLTIVAYLYVIGNASGAVVLVVLGVLALVQMVVQSTLRTDTEHTISASEVAATEKRLRGVQA